MEKTTMKEANDEIKKTNDIKRKKSEKRQLQRKRH